MPKIDVEQDVFFIKESGLFSVRLRTKEPYGKHFPQSIYVTGMFHKNKDKALEMAWKKFNEDKLYQDNYDAFYESQSSEIVQVEV